MPFPPPPPVPFLAPDMHMIQPNPSATLTLLIDRRTNLPMFARVDANIWLAAEGGPLEVRSYRTRDGGSKARQVFYDSGDRGTGEAAAAAGAFKVNIPAYEDAQVGKLPGFLRIEVRRTSDNTKVLGKTVDVCMRNTLARLDRPDSPADRTYPYIDCAANEPYALGRVVGVDRGWAAQLPLNFEPGQKIPPGNYTLRVRANASGHLADANTGNDVITTPVKVKWQYTSASVYYGGDYYGNGEGQGIALAAPANATRVLRYPDPPTARQRRRALRLRSRMSALADTAMRSATGDAATGGTEMRTTGLRMGVPSPTPPGVDLPDLRSAPSFGIGTFRSDRRDYLAFGALTWNAGPGTLEVEAFRESGSVLQAYQNFYTGKYRTDRQARGVVSFHDQHDHFHFQSFAVYRLEQTDGTVVRWSGKKSWCIVDTNIVDTTLPGAPAIPSPYFFYDDSLGACGYEPGTLWARMAMTVGAGDLYDQSIPGQAFDITNLPNGMYRIHLEANPDAIIGEQSYANNSSWRRVRLKGTRGHRRAATGTNKWVQQGYGNFYYFGGW